jgi:hypothetical protein
MNWNPFKRIAELEALHTKNVNVLSSLTDRINDLTFKLQAQGKWLVSLQNQVIHLADPKHPGAPVKQDTKAEKKRAYARAYYAKKRAAKAAEGAAK